MKTARPGAIRRVRARVPATTSNLGSAFDAVGMALGLYNEVEVKVTRSDRPLAVEIEGEGAGTLPRDKTNEVARILKLEAGIERGATVRLRNQIPVARGLGSSAAARLGALLCARALVDERWHAREVEVVDSARALEGHPDNVVPAYYGGAWLCAREKKGLVRVRLPSPRGLTAVVCVPDFELATSQARAALPQKVPLEDAVFASSRVGLLVAAFHTGLWDLLRVAMQDALHQPYRERLVPGLSAVIKAALSSGAYGAALSGAGPSVLALAPKGRVRRIGPAMERAFARHGSAARSIVLPIDKRGATVERLE